MKPPRRVKVGPLRYRVIVDQDQLDAMQARAGVEDPLLGFCSSATEAIYLAPDLGRHTERATLVHEIFHALVTNSGMGEQYGTRKVSEEEAILALDTGWLGVLRDNPKLVAYLTA